jgi:hypothetical protein
MALPQEVLEAAENADEATIDAAFKYSNSSIRAGQWMWLYMWRKRHVWLPPLLVCCAIYAVLFIIAMGPVDTPFMYRRTP